MHLNDFIDDFKIDKNQHRKQLAEDKSYEILDYIDTEDKLEPLKNTTHVGRTAPSIFVGRSSYPNISTGILAPIDPDANSADHATNSDWYLELPTTEVVGFSVDSRSSH